MKKCKNLILMLLVAEVRSLKKLFSDVEAVYSNLQTLLLRLKNGA